MAAPLLIACALGIERRALKSGISQGAAGTASAAGPVAVLRTGMGADAAHRAVTSRLAENVYAASPVIAAGFCAGLDPAMRPGDVIVADATEDESGRTGCAGGGPLLDALELLGIRTHTGLLTGVDHIVRGPVERARLRARGAVAVDMESAATLRAATEVAAATPATTTRPPDRRPVAAVRVVVDAPEHELMRIGTLRGGITAYRVLSSILPAYLEWHRSLLLPRR